MTLMENVTRKISGEGDRVRGGRGGGRGRVAEGEEKKLRRRRKRRRRRTKRKRGRRISQEGVLIKKQNGKIVRTDGRRRLVRCFFLLFVTVHGGSCGVVSVCCVLW